MKLEGRYVRDSLGGAGGRPDVMEIIAHMHEFFHRINPKLQWLPKYNVYICGHISALSPNC